MIIEIITIIQIILIITAILLLLHIAKKQKDIKKEVIVLIINIIAAIGVWLI